MRASSSDDHRNNCSDSTYSVIHPWSNQARSQREHSSGGHGPCLHDAVACVVHRPEGNVKQETPFVNRQPHLSPEVFSPAGTRAPVPLTDVPPRVFSKTMRDLDLVVSVAHAGGVDPAATESSIDMRRRLVEETADLLTLGKR